MTNRHTLGQCEDCMRVRDRFMKVPTAAEQRAEQERAEQESQPDKG